MVVDETYKLHARGDSPEGVVSYDWLVRAVARRAAHGDALTYFLDTIGPRIAPLTFDANLDVLKEYVLHQEERYAQRSCACSCQENITKAVMDGVVFASGLERALSSRRN